MAQADVMSWHGDAQQSSTASPYDNLAGGAHDHRVSRGPMAQNTLPRAASFTHLPSVPDAVFSGQQERFSLERSVSDVFNPAAVSADSSPDVTPRGTPQRGNSPVRSWAGRKKAGLVPQITISKFAPAVTRQQGDTSYKGTSARSSAKANLAAKHRTISDSFASFARRPWASTSRSPSPSSRDGEDSGRDDSASTAPSSISSTSPRISSKMLQDPERAKGVALSADPTAPTNPARKGTLLLRKSRKSAPRQLENDTPESSDTDRQSIYALPKAFSTDRLPSLGKTFTRKDTASSKPSRGEHQPVRSFEPMRKKDDLWNVFRGLESEFQKFDTKPSALKVNVVRSSLLPFLRNYAGHVSNTNLRPEDLDRRAIILDKWWTGLLDMLEGANKTIAGTDRPAVLEGLSGIMTRLEWRMPPALSPLSNVPATRNVFRSKSSTSLDSNQSEFWVESVYHNVRNLFIQNLQTQLAIIISHMSLRSAPASLVSWSGKAIAYAFYFCPGVADALVRLWEIRSDAIRRVADSFRLPRSDDCEGSLADEITAGFPSTIHSLKFTTYASTVRTLRRRSPLPLSLRNVQWDGPWTARWRGRDSDLLFVFLKHWHILLEDFIPPKAATSQKYLSPTFVIVHSQILTVLESTIHRQSNQANSGGSTGVLRTFDDVLETPDSAAAALPLPASNVTRLMAENRLVMLLRDFLSENSSEFQSARHTFAEAFTCLLRAAAQRTSIFNHPACSTLCDFMEEALFIFARYQRVDPSTRQLIDWSFWLDACKEMAKSQNTSTETRLFTFLYSIWNIVSADSELKRQVCLGWLLTDSTFNEYFTHWCPMNRALFMRLLCWRVARFDKLESELDRSILSALSQRLHGIWAQFVLIMEEPGSNTLKAPSTAPCNPVPGRRLLIVRNDTQTVPGNVFFSFDGAFSPTVPHQPKAKSQKPTLPSRPIDNSKPLVEKPSSQPDQKEPSSDVDSARKKRWSIFRNTKPMNDVGGDPPADAKIDATSAEAKFQEQAPPNGAASKSTSASSTHEPSQGKAQSTEPQHSKPPQYTHHSFKFSLESADRPYGLGKERRLHPPRLPYPALTLMPPLLELHKHDARSNKTVVPSNIKRTYIGRALAEWALVVGDGHSFFERRKHEGVPSNALVETPMLSIDSFRGGRMG